MIIGMRKEDKGIWEKRAPFAPKHIAILGQNNIKVMVEKSDIRAYTDDQYADAGAVISNELEQADIILGVKEIPMDKLLPNKRYMFFSHTIKGQSHNMPLLKKMMDLNITLMDYERITSDEGRRLVFFGPFAGNAGMIDAIWGLGRKWQKRGMDTPFLDVQQTHNYYDLAAAKKSLQLVGNKIKETGFPAEAGPVVFGFTGYGNVSLGAQEILDQFPVTPISPEELLDGLPEKEMDLNTIYKVVFTLNDLYTFKNKKPFDKFVFFKSPELFESQFNQFWPQLSVLINAIYWSEKADRIVKKEDLRKKRGKLDFIADISCDIDGGIEVTSKATTIESPFLHYSIDDHVVSEDLLAEDLTILAVDNLPCELPIDATNYFGDSLLPLLIDLNKYPLNKSKSLPQELENALILSEGKLTDNYKYLTQFL